MQSREKILSRVKANKPEAVKLPSVITYKSDFENTEAEFTNSLAAIYSKVVVVENKEALLNMVTEMYAGVSNKASTVEELSSWADFSLNVSDPHDLESIELAILRAEFGVAENGAVWISDNHLPHRVLPFITQHLALVIPRTQLVNNMHDALALLRDATGWGCFIAGPSKTADIEQSLVVGAHGARSMVVFLIGNE